MNHLDLRGNRGLPALRGASPSSLRMYAATPISPARCFTASRSSSDTGILKSAMAGIFGFRFDIDRDHTRRSLTRKSRRGTTNCRNIYIANHGNDCYHYFIAPAVPVK